ncbi:MAG TPA: hypothetical protein VFA81_03815 [Burkholderiales bacterium]|nr:hypothetical protein [Burkholderiales bacterium]
MQHKLVNVNMNVRDDVLSEPAKALRSTPLSLALYRAFTNLSTQTVEKSEQVFQPAGARPLTTKPIQLAEAE